MRNWVYNAQFEDNWSQLGNIDSFNLGMQQGKHPEEVTKNDVLSFILDSNPGRKIVTCKIEEENSMQDWINDHVTTDNIHEAIFLMDDGTLIEGEFDMGVRGLDHNCIISLAPDELSHSDKWSYIHDTFKVVRLVPEMNVALVNQGQILTAAQIEALELSSYEVEEY